MFGFRGLVETAEADLAVSMTPWKHIQRLKRDCRSGFSGLNETAESFMKPAQPSQKLILALNSFKEIL
jgi:hypothetical protein